MSDMQCPGEAQVITDESGQGVESAWVDDAPCGCTTANGEPQGLDSGFHVSLCPRAPEHHRYATGERVRVRHGVNRDKLGRVVEVKGHTLEIRIDGDRGSSLPYFVSEVERIPSTCCPTEPLSHFESCRVMKERELLRDIAGAAILMLAVCPADDDTTKAYRGAVAHFKACVAMLHAHDTTPSSGGGQ